MSTKKLTKAVIDGCESDPEKDIFLWDRTLPGFGVKVTKAGRKNFIIQYRDNRHKTKRLVISTAALMTLDQAREEARRKLQMARDGIDPAAAREERRAEPTVNEVIDRWHAEYALENLVPKPSWTNAKSEIKQLRAWLGNLLVSEITRRMIAEWHKAPEQRVRPAAANGIVERLEVIWSWAEANDVLPANAPTATKLFWKFGWYKENKRKRRFSEVEYQRFYRAIQTHRENGDLNVKHVTLTELLLVAGLRLREGMRLRYDKGGRDDTNYIDEQQQLLVFQRHKTWQESGVKYVPITPEIQAVLDRCKAFRVVGNPYVFAADRMSPSDPNMRGPMKYAHRSFAKICETAGIPCGRKVENGVTPHDLRRSLISFGINRGNVPLAKMTKTIGSADEQTVREHYFQLDADERRAAMTKTTAKLAEVLNGSAT